MSNKRKEATLVDNNMSLSDKLKLLYKSQNTVPKLIDHKTVPDQTWEDYFIKLNVLLLEDGQNEEEVVKGKQEIQIENIFNEIDERNAEVGKILLLGGAGTGKTTMLHYIPYRWANNQLWNDKFDYVFRIKLKKLSNDIWDKAYVNEEDREEKLLACFIHLCLKQQINDAKIAKKPEGGLKINLSDILEILDNDRVLLLLDGYNEMSSFVRDYDRREEYDNIIEQVFDYTHLIMTSRPNSLEVDDKERFERIVENQRLDFERITRYVSKYFVDHDLFQYLIMFLKNNNQVREMCEIPINIVLITLIWGDKEIRKHFVDNAEFNIASLYQEVIIWLGKRYLIDFEKRDMRNISISNILESQIVKFLKIIAYEAFVNQGHFISSDVINDNLGELNMEIVCNFGLLLTEDDGTEILNFNYHFVHPTFQEYLTAEHLKSLMSDCEDVAVKYCLLIGEHRNEPKYLLMLKFLSGIVSNEQVKQKSNDKDLLLKRFWEAATCNVDGVLELGLESKVTLLMHLLEQGKVNGKFYIKIPNLDTIKRLIDNTVLTDITKWGEQIVESGYVSEQIADYIKSTVLENKNNGIYKLKIVVDVITNLANKNEFGGRLNVLDIVMSLVNANDWKLQKLGLEKLNYLLDKTISNEILDKNQEIVMQLMKNKNLSEYVNIILIKIVILAPTLCVKLIDYLTIVVEDCNIKNSYHQLAALKIMPNIIQTMTKEPVNLSESLTYQVVDRIFQLLVFVIKGKYSKSYKTTAIAMIKNIVKVTPTTQQDIVAIKAFTIFTNDLNDNRDFSILQIDTIIDILHTMNKELASDTAVKTFNELIAPMLHNPPPDHNFWDSIARSIVKLVRVVKANELDPIIILLFNFLNVNMNIEIADIIPKFREVMTAEKTSELADQAIATLVYGINEPNYEHMGETISAINSLPSIVQIIEKDQAKVAFNVYQEMLNALKLLRTDLNFPCVAISSITRLMNFMQPDHLDVAIKGVFDILYSALINATVDPFTFAALTDIMKLIKIMQPNQALDATEKVFKLFAKLIITPDTFNLIQIASITNVTRMIKMFPSDRIPQVAMEAFEIFASVVRNQHAYDDCRIKALSSIIEIVQLVPSDLLSYITNEAFDLLVSVILNNDTDDDCKLRAAENLPALLNIMLPYQSTQLTERSIELLGKLRTLKYDMYNYSPVAYNIAYNIEAIVDVMTSEQASNSADNTFKLINEMLNDPKVNHRYKREITFILARIVEKVKLNRSTNLLSHDLTEVREAAQMGILNKLTNAGEYTQNNFQQIIDILNIINLNRGEEQREREVYVAANNKLKQIMANINHDGVQWITDSFSELPISYETRTFLKGVYHKVLGAMNTLSSEFIIKCIEYGLTTTILRLIRDDGEYIYKLVFEDVFYTFNHNNQFYLESITQAIVHHKKDSLSDQYRHYKPLFINSEAGLSIAASDIQECSLVNGCIINSELWQLSLMHLSDHLKKEPSHIFVLLEKRDHFGYHVIYKIFVRNGKMCNQFYLLHPCKISDKIRTEIFGTMEYLNTTPRYYGSIVNLCLEKGNELLRKVECIEIDGNKNDYKTIHEFICKFIDWEYKKWNEYVDKKNIEIFTKNTLFKLVGVQADTVRNLEKIMTIEERLNHFYKITQEVKNYIKSSDDINEQNKSAMLTRVQTIVLKVETMEKTNIDSYDKVKNITKEMSRFVCEEKLIDRRLNYLEDQVDLILDNNDIRV